MLWQNNTTLVNTRPDEAPESEINSQMKHQKVSTLNLKHQNILERKYRMKCKENKYGHVFDGHGNKK